MSSVWQNNKLLRKWEIKTVNSSYYLLTKGTVINTVMEKIFLGNNL